MTDVVRMLCSVSDLFLSSLLSLYVYNCKWILPLVIVSMLESFFPLTYPPFLSVFSPVLHLASHSLLLPLSLSLSVSLLPDSLSLSLSIYVPLSFLSIHFSFSFPSSVSLPFPSVSVFSYEENSKWCGVPWVKASTRLPAPSRPVPWLLAALQA